MYFDEPANITDIGGMLSYVDKVTCIARTNSSTINNCASGGGWFGIGILIAVYFFFFIGIKASGYKTSGAFIGAGAVGFLVSIILRLLNLTQDVTVAVAFVILIAGIIIVSREEV